MGAPTSSKHDSNINKTVTLLYSYKPNSYANYDRLFHKNIFSQDRNAFLLKYTILTFHLFQAKQQRYEQIKMQQWYKRRATYYQTVRKESTIHRLSHAVVAVVTVNKKECSIPARLTRFSYNLSHNFNSVSCTITKHIKKRCFSY